MLFKRVSPSKGLPIAFCRGLRRLPSFASCSVGNEACHCVRQGTRFPFKCNLACDGITMSGTRIGAYKRGVGIRMRIRGGNTCSARSIIRVCMGGVSDGGTVPGPVLTNFRQVFLGTKRYQGVRVPV